MSIPLAFRVYAFVAIFQFCGQSYTMLRQVEDVVLPVRFLSLSVHLFFVLAILFDKVISITPSRLWNIGSYSFPHFPLLPRNAARAPAPPLATSHPRTLTPRTSGARSASQTVVASTKLSGVTDIAAASQSITVLTAISIATLSIQYIILFSGLTAFKAGLQVSPTHFCPPPRLRPPPPALFSRPFNPTADSERPVASCSHGCS